MTKNGGVAGCTEYFCYVLSGKLTSEDGSYLMDAVLVVNKKYCIALGKKKVDMQGG